MQVIPVWWCRWPKGWVCDVTSTHPLPHPSCLKLVHHLHCRMKLYCVTFYEFPLYISLDCRSCFCEKILPRGGLADILRKALFFRDVKVLRASVYKICIFGYRSRTAWSVTTRSPRSIYKFYSYKWGGGGGEEGPFEILNLIKKGYSVRSVVLFS